MKILKYAPVLLFAFAIGLGSVYIYKLVNYNNTFKHRKKNQYIKSFVIDLPYRNIYDRNGNVLAESVAKYSYFLDTSSVEDQNELSQIAAVFGADLEKLKAKYEKKKKFAWLLRKNDTKIQHNFKGIYEIIEYERFYPYGKIISHIIGVRNKENESLGGLELSLNNALKTGKEIIKILRGADGKKYLIENFEIPTTNTGIATTLDMKLQTTLYDISSEAYLKWNPQSLVAIVIDPNTGDILAWVQIPTFDPDTYNNQPISLFKNLSLTSPLEPGSTFKPLFYYTLLKKGVITESTKVYCENGHFKIRARHIYDHTSHGTLKASEVIAYSSNIGITKLTQKLSKKDYIETLQTFNMLSKFSIGFLNTLKTKITPPNRWTYHTLISLPMGYEILTSAFHLIRAYAAFANGGNLVNISILKNRPILSKRILDEEIVEKVNKALRLVTQVGTAKRADSKLYIVSGKTGTSKLLDESRRYTAAKHRSFFIGFGPQNSPKLLVYFQIDEPKGAYFGGTVAAPYVREFIEKSLQKLFVEFENSDNTRTLTKAKRK